MLELARLAFMNASSQRSRRAAHAVSHNRRRKVMITCLSLMCLVALSTWLNAVVCCEAAGINLHDRRSKGHSRSAGPHERDAGTLEVRETTTSEETSPNNGANVVSTDADHETDITCAHQACCRTWREKLKALWSRVFPLWRAGAQPGAQKCVDVKRRGGVPSVHAGHSPIKTFGYPYFDEKSSRVFLKPGIPLSVVRGYMQPIRVGAADYIITGTLGEIIAFLQCFEKYEVIASTLNPEGHWVSEAGQSNIVLQMQNVSAGLPGPVELDARLLEKAFDEFTKMLCSMRKEAATALANRINDALEAAEQIQSLKQLKDLSQLCTDAVHCRTAKELRNSIWCYIKYATGWEGLDEEKGWTDSKSVDLTKTLSLKISSYPQPSHGVRATLTMPVNKATLKDIRLTLPKVFGASGGEPDKQ